MKTVDCIVKYMHAQCCKAGLFHRVLIRQTKGKKNLSLATSCVYYD